ncbi:hypothetical protein, partial [Mesorhizobium japonicum]|uniref:hypothetical protein n=1 Tax=Mesorhizobium japonicum TaxID=2066070 RepID=UPI003B5CDAB6
MVTSPHSLGIWRLGGTMLVVGGVLVAALTAAIIPLVIAAASGNLSIPHNDAWAYSRIAEVFWSTGRVELVGWNRSPLVGQLLLLAPLGFSVTAQQAGVAALALGTVILTYVLARRYIGDRRGALVAVTVALWPGLALLATSYMTDVPSAFGCVACLAIGDRALREERQGRARLLLVAATLVGLWAVSVRTQTLAAPVAILIAAWCDRAARRRIGSPLIATALVASAAVAAAVIAWHDQQPRADAPDGALTAQTLASIATSGLQWAFTVGLALSPVVVAVARPALWRPSAWVVAATAGAAGAGWAVAVGTDRFFLGNYLS